MSEKVMMIGLDAADWTKIQNFMAEGKMPTLKKLFAEGPGGRLHSPADAWAGAVWPDFYTGCSVAAHGIYHNKLWHADSMQVRVPDDRWLGLRPFHEDLSARGKRICVLDLPMVLGAPRAVNGSYLGGWGTHDLISKGSWPPELWRELKQKFSPPKMPVEAYGRQSAQDLHELADKLCETTEQITQIATDLLHSDPDFSLIVLGATHRAGHYLWDTSQIEADHESGSHDLDNALERIYVDADKALSRLLEQAGDKTHCVVFAVHGMTENHGWSDLGPELVDAILQSGSQEKPKKGWLYQIRRKLPMHWVRPILTRLPTAASSALVRFWSKDMFDWTQTRWFPIPMDQAGYIRVNLKGRESQGIVSMQDYNRLCEQIEQSFRGIYDPASGKSLVSRIERPWQTAGADARARDVLPDLLIHWSDLKLATTRRLRHRHMEKFDFAVPIRTLSGRSGNHVGQGWFVYRGPGTTSAVLEGFSILDLAPTVYDLLGLPCPEGFEGQAIPLRTANEARP